MNIWYILAKLLSVHRDLNAVRRGPRAMARRAERKALYRLAGREINRRTR